MPVDATNVDSFQGGCQCGAVRYEVSGGPVRMILCHCDMCRRATASPLPGFVSVPRDRVTWHGTPSVFRSSSVAERGFCAACGTPLFYRQDGRDTIGLTAGSARIAFVPTAEFYPEERADWLLHLEDLTERTFDGTEGMTRHGDD